MSARKLVDSMRNLRRAMKGLSDAFEVTVDRPLVMEGTIHRFEMTIELTWKTMQRALQYEGVRAKTPRETLKAAHKLGWITDEPAWLAMVQQRNETSHEYLDETIVQANYDAARRGFPHLQTLLRFLEDRYAEEIEDEL